MEALDEGPAGNMRAHQFLASVGAIALVATGALVGGGATAATAATSANPAPTCVANPSLPGELSCTVTYNAIDAEQTFTVPVGVSNVEVELIGARGGSVWYGYTGGKGARVAGSMSVSANQTFYVNVGGNGLSRGLSGGGGYNGGGDHGLSTYVDSQGGGGGATDIREVSAADSGSLESRVAVAGAGGGGTSSARGGSAGLDGQGPAWADDNGGHAGTQTEGGAGGTGPYDQRGKKGALGVGGAGGDYKGYLESIGGGGGGGGYYGGGGGTGGGQPGGGGGGSSYVPAGWVTEISDENARASFTYSVPATSTVVTAPTTPALQSAAVSAYASTNMVGHSGFVTDRITELSVVAAQTPGGDVSDVTCDATSCTSAKAGVYSIRASFGTWASPIDFTLEFTPVAQTIDFVGHAIDVQQPVALGATATSGLPVSYTLDSGPCVLVGDTLTATDLGTCRVTASQDGANPYLAATPVVSDFTVNPVTFEVTSDPAVLTVVAGQAPVAPVVLRDAQGDPVVPQPVIDYSYGPECEVNSDGAPTRAGACSVTATVQGSTLLTTNFTL